MVRVRHTRVWCGLHAPQNIRHFSPPVLHVDLSSFCMCMYLWELEAPNFLIHVHVNSVVVVVHVVLLSSKAAITKNNLLKW